MLKNIHHKMQAMPASVLNGTFILILCLMLGGVQLMASFTLHANWDLSFTDNVRRVALVKQAVRTPQSIGVMNRDDIQILLLNPSLKRSEETVVAWHYHGESCALDVYFRDDKSRPDYIEFRALSMNADVNSQFETVDQTTLNDYCLRDVMESQGVNTPNSYARQPTPSWENPYRT